MVTRTIGCVCIALTAACGSSSTGDQPHATGAVTFELRRLTTICSDAVERSSCGIGKPRLLRLLPDTSVLFVDGQTDVVRVLPDGHRLRVGRAGDGPGEFRFVADLLVSSDTTLDILDVRHFRIERFMLSGELLKSWPASVPLATTDIRLGRSALATLQLKPGRALGSPTDGRIRIANVDRDSSTRTFFFGGHTVQLVGTDFRPAFIPFRPSVHWAVSPSGRASYSYGSESTLQLLPKGDTIVLPWLPIDVTPAERDSAVNQLINPGSRRSQANSYNERARTLVDSIPTKHEIVVEHFFDNSDRLWVRRGGNTVGPLELRLVDSAGVRLDRTLHLPSGTVAWATQGNLVAIYRVSDADGGTLELHSFSLPAGDSVLSSKR